VPRLELGLNIAYVESGAHSAGRVAGFSNTYSLEFDGTDDELNCGTSTTLEPNHVTVSVWVNPQSDTTYRYFVNKIYSAGQGAYALGPAASNKIRFYVSTAGGALQIAPLLDSTGLTDTWLHLVGTYDGDFVRLYKNGSEQGSGTDTSEAGNITYNGTQGFSIGHFTNNYYAHAIIDEIGVFDTAISAADVTALYNSGVPTDLTNSGSYDTDRTGNLIGYWRMEEGTGTSVTNTANAGTGDGTIANSTAWDTDVPS